MAEPARCASSSTLLQLCLAGPCRNQLETKVVPQAFSWGPSGCAAESAAQKAPVIGAGAAMQVTPEKYLQRCAIVSPSGEECVLTFNVILQEALECQ